MARFYELKIDVEKVGDASLSWLITAPAFPEIRFLADDNREAFVQGLHAIEEAIARRFANGVDIPAPTNTRPGYFVEVPAMTFLKVALHMICSRRGVSRAELSRRLEWHREQVDRLFRLDHECRLDQMEAAFEAVGIPLATDSGSHYRPAAATSPVVSRAPANQFGLGAVSIGPLMTTSSSRP